MEMTRFSPVASPARVVALTVVSTALVAVATVCAVTTEAARAAHCTQPNDRKPAAGPALRQRTKLVPDPRADVVNYGFERGQKHLELVFNVAPRFPQSVKAAQLTIGMARSLRRNEGDKLATVTFPKPKFTKLRIRPGGRQVIVTACLNADGVASGAYTGPINASGPRRLSPGTVNVTVNLKNGLLFGLGLTAALGAAFLLMWYRSGKQAKAANERLWAAMKRTLKDFDFWAASVVGLVAGVIAGVNLYVGDVSWGDDPAPSIIALGSTTLAAAGVQNLIATVRGKG
jgi:hypothetical protein